MPRLASAILLLGSLFAASSAAAQEPRGAGLAGAQEVRVTAESRPGLSPWSSVRYTLWVREGSATISVTKDLAGEFGTTRRVGLLSEASLARTLGLLAGCEVEALPSVERVRGKVAKQAWDFTVQRGGAEHRFVVGDPELQDDRRYRRCLRALEEAADEVVGELSFRDTFFEPGTFGYLQVLSTPTAQVWVDDVDMASQSPIYGIRLQTGVHTVRLFDRDSGLDRTYSVHVLDDVTTNLDVELW